MGSSTTLAREPVTLITRTEDPLTPTIFHESWWLEAASPDYQQVEVTHGSRVVGRFPFVIERRLWFQRSTLPALTHVLGPAVDEGNGSPNTRLLHRYTITRELVAKLPNVHRFRQKLHRGYPEVLSFQSTGFKTGVQFTFEVRPRDLADLWANLRNKTRNVIRRAQEDYTLAELNDIEEFVRFQMDTLKARERQAFHLPDVYERICGAAIARDRGKIFCIRQGSTLVAAAFFVWDTKAVYYLLSSRSMNAGNGAISLLIWTGIALAQERGLVFDFDGVASEGSVLLFAGFGGTPTPRYTVTRENYFVQFADLARRASGVFHESLFDG